MHTYSRVKVISPFQHSLHLLLPIGLLLYSLNINFSSSYSLPNYYHYLHLFLCISYLIITIQIICLILTHLHILIGCLQICQGCFHSLPSFIVYTTAVGSLVLSYHFQILPIYYSFAYLLLFSYHNYFTPFSFSKALVVNWFIILVSIIRICSFCAKIVIDNLLYWNRGCQLHSLFSHFLCSYISLN